MQQNIKFIHQGYINKLFSELGNPIQYYLPLSEEKIALNDLLNQRIQMVFQGEIHCIQCYRKTKKSFQQGYCYPCYQKLHNCNFCIIHPEKCNYPNFDCPDTWEHQQCKQPHIVYLANSSGLKVGITRQMSLQTRWIDQGALQAIPIIKVLNRYHAGIIEVALKKYVADKTNWRKMLTNQIEQIDMNKAREKLLKQAGEDLDNLNLAPTEMEFLKETDFNLQYPVIDYPQKLHAFSFEKQNVIDDVLIGIKGQYLLFKTGILNVRKHSGYLIHFNS